MFDDASNDVAIFLSSNKKIFCQDTSFQKVSKITKILNLIMSLRILQNFISSKCFYLKKLDNIQSTS